MKNNTNIFVCVFGGAVSFLSSAMLKFDFASPVCVQTLGTSAPDGPVHFQDLTAVAVTMGYQVRENTTEEFRKGMPQKPLPIS